jgi:hypothetical protein
VCPLAFRKLYASVMKTKRMASRRRSDNLCMYLIRDTPCVCAQEESNSVDRLYKCVCLAERGGYFNVERTDRARYKRIFFYVYKVACWRRGQFCIAQNLNIESGQIGQHYLRA